ncbi:MAG: hypothetical protein AAB975_00820 [Patescibacteria group bacterium]
MNKIGVKEVVLCVVYVCAVVGSFWFWRSSTAAIAQEAFNSYGQFIASISSLVLAASLFGIVAIFVRTTWIIYPFVAVSVAAPFLFIPFSRAILIVMAVCVLLTLFAVRRIRKDASLSWGFSVANMFKSGVPLFLTVFGIVISIFYLNDVQTKDAIRSIFPRTAFNVTVRALGGPLRSLTGNEQFTPEQTVDDFFQELVKKQLSDRGIRIDQVPGKELQRLLAQQRDEIGRSYGIKLTGNEKIGDVFYTTIIERINDLLGPYRVYVPYASAVTFFLAFKTLSIFLYFAVVGVAFLFIRFMIIMNILTRKKEQIEVERLTLG